MDEYATKAGVVGGFGLATTPPAEFAPIVHATATPLKIYTLPDPEFAVEQLKELLAVNREILAVNREILGVLKKIHQIQTEVSLRIRF